VIVTLTLNPSVDRTVEVERLARGEVTRAIGVRVEPGGKGINVSRALATHGLPTRAVITVGGPEGEHLITLLRDTGIEIVPVRIGRAIRSNIAVVEPDGTTTKLNEPGGQLSASELEAVFAAVKQAVQGAGWLVLSGSLPTGMPPEIYADLIRSLRGTGTRIAVDTSGPPLKAVLGAGPDLVKPNGNELAEVTGMRLSTIAEAIDAASRLRDLGAKAVLASLGADGAVLVDESGATHGRTPVVSPVSSVGAGDAMLAGFLAGGGHGSEALTEGLAWGAAAVLQPGSGMPSPRDIDRAGVLLEGPINQRLELLAMPP
jgi:1-phosphofructokinase